MSQYRLIVLLMALTIAAACSSGTPVNTGAQSSGTPAPQGNAAGNSGGGSSTGSPAAPPTDVTQPPTVPPPASAVCGNSKVESGEQCDDGNTVSGDGCDAICKLESCGDGIAQFGLGEECDGSNLNGSSCGTFGYSLGSLSCTIGCKFDKTGCSNPPPAPVCGNGAIESGEQCDDSNVVSNDGCSATCKIEYCGDAVVQSGLGEECDGSNLNGSSCSTFGYTVGSLSCGGTCKFVKTGCSAVCGNGIKETGEQCDDGNTFNWDGCSATCQSEPAPTIGTNFMTSENLWDSKKQTTGSITFGTADVSSVDNAVVSLMFPGVPGQVSTYKPGPANATQISTKQLVSFGTYRTRVKFATCAATEEVVNGVFLYSYGGDTNANGITDNNEIDFEVLCGEPRYLYITTWTDYDYNATTEVETFLKVTRTVDMTTGVVYQTKPGFENSYGNMAQVATIPDAVISNFLVSGAYYELGLDYQNNHLRFTIINNGKEVTLWDYTDSQYIPQNPMYFMFNTWHTVSHWWVGGDANYPANNALMSVDYFKYWAY